MTYKDNEDLMTKIMTINQHGITTGVCSSLFLILMHWSPHKFHYQKYSVKLTVLLYWSNKCSIKYSIKCSNLWLVNPIYLLEIIKLALNAFNLFQVFADFSWKCNGFLQQIIRQLLNTSTSHRVTVYHYR